MHVAPKAQQTPSVKRRPKRRLHHISKETSTLIINLATSPQCDGDIGKNPATMGLLTSPSHISLLKEQHISNASRNPALKGPLVLLRHVDTRDIVRQLDRSSQKQSPGVLPPRGYSLHCHF